MKKKILIVEDEYLIASALQMTLLDEGYDICEIASTHEKALEIIDRDMPDLVILDIHISGEENGLASAFEIKKKCTVPLIFMTGTYDKNLEKQAFELAPAAYFTKPFDVKSMLKSIKQALDTD